MDKILARLYAGDYDYLHVVINGDTDETTVVFGNKKEDKQFVVKGKHINDENPEITSIEEKTPKDEEPKFKKNRKKDALEELKK